ncbi:unnamed protein product [Hymenolepis diminuta]|uniref:Uncharacterized protein n=1 Tax=Hymenolepis diminuta TaxID=6216 RepID=A0A0R3SKY8_HYMDI|nr:unnamed protein product [Hymenolepis diminuta]
MLLPASDVDETMVLSIDNALESLHLVPLLVTTAMTSTTVNGNATTRAISTQLVLWTIFLQAWTQNLSTQTFIRRRCNTTLLQKFLRHQLTTSLVIMIPLKPPLKIPLLFLSLLPSITSHLFFFLNTCVQNLLSRIH